MYMIFCYFYLFIYLFYFINLFFFSIVVSLSSHFILCLSSSCVFVIVMYCLFSSLKIK